MDSELICARCGGAIEPGQLYLSARRALSDEEALSAPRVVVGDTVVHLYPCTIIPADAPPVIRPCARGPRWADQLSRRLGELIYEARNQRNMSALALSEATRRYGASVHRIAIPQIEMGRRSLSVTQLIAVGAALDADWLGWLSHAADAADGNTRGAL